MAFPLLLLYTGTVFIIDVQTPLGISAGILYLLPIIVEWKNKSVMDLYAVTLLVSVLTILGYVFSSGGDYQTGLVNRLVTIIFFWISAFLVKKVLIKEIDLQKLNKKLKQQVIMQTSQLNDRLSALEKSNRKLRESQGLLKKTFESMTESVIILNPSTRYIIDCNPATEIIFGYRKEELIGKSVRLLHLDDDHFKNFGRQAMEKLRENKIFQTEFLMKKKDGKTFISDHTVSIVQDENGAMDKIVSVVRDITIRKRAFDTLLKSEKEARLFARQLHSVLEEERARIAREIHDELGQRLVGLKMQLSLLNLENRDDKTAIADIQQEIDKTTNSLKNLAMELRPGILDTLGLLPSLEWLARDFEKKSGILIDLEVIGSSKKINKDISIACFRICQEALTNVIKHSNARKVKIKVKTSSDKLVLFIEDDGKGVGKKELENPYSLGILGMRERAQLIDADLSIESKPGKGTRIKVISKVI